MLLAQAVAVLVDVIFSVLGVGYVLEEEGRGFEIVNHCLEGHVQKIEHPVKPLDHLVIEGLAVVKGALHHPADGLAGVSDAFQLADHPVHRLDSQCGDSADVTLGHLVQVGSDLIFNLVRDALVLDKFLIDGLKFGLGLGAHRTADEADLPAAYFRKMNDFLLGLVEGKFRRGKRSALNELEAINLLLSLRGRDDPVDSLDELRDEPDENQGRGKVEDRVQDAYSVKHRVLLLG